VSAEPNEFVTHVLEMSYHAAPDGALEDAELLRDRARTGVDATMRAAREKPPKNKR